MNSIDEHENVASATECTGLMATMPRDMAEDESQAELYALHPAVRTKKKWTNGVKKRR